MKVLLIHQAFASTREAGGTRHFELARHLVREGHQVTVVASSVSYLTGRHMKKGEGLFRREEVEGVEILRAYTLPALHRSYVWRVMAFVSFMVTSLIAALTVKDVDLVMGTTPPIFQAGSAWLITRLRRRPFLLEIRDLWPQFAIEVGVLTNPILIRASRWFERFLYTFADHILVNSPAYLEYLVGKGISEEMITFIPNGVDTHMFDPDARGEEIREGFSLGGKWVVTYAGALGKANDIDTIMRAASRLLDEPHIQFLLVGDGKERERLKAMAEAMALLNVTFAEFYPKEDMKDLLAASDACVATLKDIPAFRTTYPNKVFDYMAAGRPVILGIDGVIRDVVDKAGAGMFVHPGDDEALASAVRELSRDPKRSQSMGNAGREYVERHFDRKRQAEDFLRLIERLRK